jgi:hypothetical protein
MSVMPEPGPRPRMAPRLERLVAEFAGAGRMGCAKEQENRAIFMESPYRVWDR